MTILSARRLRELKEAASVAAREQRERLRPAYGNFIVRCHTIAAAAILLYGKPKIDEPVRITWKRTLRHCGIEVTDPHSLKGQRDAARELWPKIDNGEKETTQFAQIFAKAPAWFIQFTRITLDAFCLKFNLIVNDPARCEWGSAGLEEARRWPRLPSGTLNQGDPISFIDYRRIEIALMSFGFPFAEVKAGSHGAPPSASSLPPLLREIEFALDLDRKPEMSWTRYEQRRMRDLERKIQLMTSRNAGSANPR